MFLSYDYIKSESSIKHVCPFFECIKSFNKPIIQGSIDTDDTLIIFITIAILCVVKETCFRIGKPVTALIVEVHALINQIYRVIRLSLAVLLELLALYLVTLLVSTLYSLIKNHF